MTPILIQGLPKDAVYAALHNASVSRMGGFGTWPAYMTVRQTALLSRSGGNGFTDLTFRIDISGTSADPTIFDHFNGSGAAERAIRLLRNDLARGVAADHLVGISDFDRRVATMVRDYRSSGGIALIVEREDVAVEHVSIVVPRGQSRRLLESAGAASRLSEDDVAIVELPILTMQLARAMATISGAGHVISGVELDRAVAEGSGAIRNRSDYLFGQGASASATGAARGEAGIRRKLRYVTMSDSMRELVVPELLSLAGRRFSGRTLAVAFATAVARAGVELRDRGDSSAASELHFEAHVKAHYYFHALTDDAALADGASVAFDPPEPPGVVPDLAATGRALA